MSTTLMFLCQSVTSGEEYLAIILLDELIIGIVKALIDQVLSCLDHAIAITHVHIAVSVAVVHFVLVGHVVHGLLVVLVLGAVAVTHLKV